MTNKEVANYLNLSIPTVYDYFAKRNIPHSKRGNRLYFDKNDIDQWILGIKQKTNRKIEMMTDDYLTKYRMKFRQ
jgi:excisionase family DNA binding protein